MALEKELNQRSIPISEVTIEATEFVLKLQLLRCGPIVDYKTKKSEGVRQQLIFVDEEGTKIQTTLFGEFTEKWKTSLVASNCYYVINGRIKRANLLYSNVNKFKDLSITQFTEIRDCTSSFMTSEFWNGFTSIDFLDHKDKNEQYDVVGILVEISELKETAKSKRRVVTITNEWNARVAITLWGEHATYDSLCLDITETCKTVVAFCNLKITEFNGILAFASTGATSVLLNPKLERAEELLQWNKTIIDKNIDLRFVPSSNIRRASEKKIAEILDIHHDNPQNVFSKFNATVKEILRKDTLCYNACKKCNKKVKINDNTIYCDNCGSYQDGFTYRYFLKLLLDFGKDKELSMNCLSTQGRKDVEPVGNNAIDQDKTGNAKENVTADGQAEYNEESKRVNNQQSTITVKLFEGAKYLLGCTADEYMASIAEKQDTSEYYKKLLKAEGQRYTFMVKNYHTLSQTEREEEMVIDEMHLVGHTDVPDIEHAGPTIAASLKRSIEYENEDEERDKQLGKKKKKTKKI